MLLSRAIGAGDATDPIVLSIDPRLAAGGFLKITLRYSGALNSDRCLDQRVAGDFLSILPDTVLEMQLAPEAYADVRSVVNMLPRDVGIVLPDRELQPAEISAALRIASISSAEALRSRSRR